MNHTDIFMLIINIFFSDGFVTFLLLSIGLYRLIDGINRVKFENTIDDRVDFIPDKNVYFFWLRISHLNGYLHYMVEISSSSKSSSPPYNSTKVGI